MDTRKGLVVLIKRIQLIAILLVGLSCTNAKTQMPADFSDLKSLGLKGPVKKLTSTTYNENEFANNKPIHKGDYTSKDEYTFNENGGMGISGTTDGTKGSKGKTYYIKSVPLSSNEFPLKIDLITLVSNDGSKYEELEVLKRAIERKWVNSGLWVTNYYANGKPEGGFDSTWIDTFGVIKKTKHLMLIGSMKVTKVVEVLSNSKQGTYQQIIRTTDDRDPAEKTTISDVTALQPDQYGNPTYFIRRNTTTGRIKLQVQEIEYYPTVLPSLK